MRRTRLGAALLAATTLLASGCWIQPGFDAGRTHANTLETTILWGNVADVVPRWETTIPDASDVTISLSYGVHAFGSATRQGEPLVFGLHRSAGELMWTTVVGDPDMRVQAMAYFEERIAVVVSTYPEARDEIVWLDPATGAVVERDVVADQSVLDLAVPYGEIAVLRAEESGERPPGYADRRWVDWEYDTAPVSSWTFPQTFAIRDDRVLYGHGSTATGYSPACPPPPPPADPTAGCAPDWTTEVGFHLAGPTVVSQERVAYAGLVDDGGAGGTRVSVLDQANGSVAWTADLPATRVTRMAVARGKLLVRTEDGLIVYVAAGCAAPTCTPEWRANLTVDSLVVGGHVAYVSSHLASSEPETFAFGVDGCGTPVCEPIAVIPGTRPIVANGLVLTTTRNSVIGSGLPD